MKKVICLLSLLVGATNSAQAINIKDVLVPVMGPTNTNEAGIVRFTNSTSFASLTIVYGSNLSPDFCGTNFNPPITTSGGFTPVAGQAYYISGQFVWSKKTNTSVKCIALNSNTPFSVGPAFYVSCATPSCESSEGLTAKDWGI
ncbi:MAG: hypothetical protein P1U34_02590 [Coxiellaceae bacterium]|nr:hypothetical protein [Coxiellaceae bacterium]